MSELTEEQKQHVLHATTSGVIDLLHEHPELAIRLAADDIVQVYVAGVVAGAETTVRLLGLIARDLEEES